MSSTPSAVFQTADFTKAVGPLTGRTLYINNSVDWFLIPPTFDAARAREAASCFDTHWRTNKGRGVPTPDLRPYLATFQSVDDISEFGQALTLLVKEGLDLPGNTNKGSIMDLLVALWNAGCLVLPRNAGPFISRLHKGHVFWGSSDARPCPSEIIKQFDAVSNAHPQGTKVQRRKLLTLMLSIGGVRECGDLTPEILSGRLAGWKLAPSLSSNLVTMIRAQSGAPSVSFNEDDYGPFGRQGKFGDNTFSWALEQDAGLEEWRALCAEWLGHEVRDIMGRRNALNSLLKYLIAHPAVPRTPQQFLSTGAAIEPPLEKVVTYRRSRITVWKFLDWIISTRFVDEDDHGHPYVLPGYRNPMVLVDKADASRPETVREAMPTRFVRRLREIIEENNFAWPRTAFERGVDTIRWLDPETRKWKDVWCPVRALAVLMKLEIPERTFQVRVCNSGEADPERYDVRSNTWEANNHPLAGQMPHGHPMGLARKIYDPRANRYFTGLYFNTNKTGDIGKSAADRGHVIPWQNERILGIYDTMRNWQEKYNPVLRPTAWSEIDEDAVSKRYSPKLLEARGAETFLFRDACSAYPVQPIAHTRLTIFWNKLCAELERRLAEEGETGPSGDPIRLVLRDRNGRVSGTVFNLHALRVTMITAYAEAGVPIEIMLKVTGHASAIMLIYYQKQSISHVTEILDSASIETMQNEQRNWLTWLKSKSYEHLKPLMAWNDAAGLQAFANGSGASLVRRDHGICPVGCARCHEGGEKVGGAAKQQAYYPVPGGSQNCVRCRFFLTGPEFVIGLSAHFEDIGFRLQEASKAYTKATTEFERLDHERKIAVAKREPFTRHSELDVASSALDQRTREVDELALSWHAAYNLLEQCKVIVQNPQLKGDSSKSALIAVGSRADLEFVLELDERNEREFELVDKLCQNAVFFPSIHTAVPNLKRMRKLDAFLARNGYEPVFLSMSEEDALAFGNEYASFLFRSFGQRETNRLMNGEAMLKGMGVETEGRVVERLASITGLHLRRKGRARLIEQRAAL